MRNIHLPQRRFQAMHEDKVLGVRIMSKAVRVEGGSRSSVSAGLQELGARR